MWHILLLIIQVMDLIMPSPALLYFMYTDVSSDFISFYFYVFFTTLPWVLKGEH